MKVTVDVDCTPDEARTFLGLPDLTPLHDRYTKAMLEAMDGTANLEQLENMFRSLSPMGEASMQMFRKMMDLGMRGGLGGFGSGNSDKS